MKIVRTFATSANLGPGFDCLGICFDLYNEYEFFLSDKYTIEGFSEKFSNPSDNLIVKSYEKVFLLKNKKIQFLTIRQKIQNIPVSRGLGSSASCIVAGIIMANEILGGILSKDEIFQIASMIEGHPDNTTPAILGGLTVSAMDAGRVYSVGTQVSDKFRFALLIPDFQLKTEQSRATLPMQYSKQDAVYNLSRSALMVASLSCGKAENLRIAVQDKLHQPFRVDLIENCAEIFELTYQNGSLGTYISGAGPCIMSIIESGNTAYYNRMIKQLEEHGIIGWKLEVLETDREGTKVLPTI